MAFRVDELNARYSAFIKDYFDRGFVISPLIIGDNGFPINLYFFQKGLTFFDLINPKEKNVVYRMWIKNICNTHYDKPNEPIKIEVRQYDRKIFRNSLWPEEGNLVDEKTFFFVLKTKTDVDSIYTDDEHEIELINKRRFDRGVLHSSLKRLENENKCRSLKIEKLPANFIDNIMARINSKKGFKHANATCINTVLLYKESYYDLKRHKKLINKLKVQVSFSYKNKTGCICLS